jgi:predicted short-subunit dehydrogenase-like oxidoreductase (DUF2520 family)
VNIHIVGFGAVGRNVAASLEPFFPVRIFSSQKSNEIPGVNFSTVNWQNPDVEPGDITFLCLPDRLIGSFSSDWATRLAKHQTKGLVVHMSGSAPLSELEPLSKLGFETACIHPLQTFTHRISSQIFTDSYATFLGSDEAFDSLSDVFFNLKIHVLRVTEAEKQAIHIAAVFVSNFLVSLVAFSNGVIPETVEVRSQNLFSSLMKQTLANILEKPDLFDALSGPVKRGDATTLIRHIESLSGDKEALAVYKVLTNRLLALKEKTEKGLDSHDETLKTWFDEKF